MGNNQVQPLTNQVSGINVVVYQNIKLECYCPVCDIEHYIIVKLPKIEPWNNLRAASDISDYIYTNVNKHLKKFTKDCYTKDELGVGKFELTDFIVLQQFYQYLELNNRQDIKDGVYVGVESIDWEIDGKDFNLIKG